MAGNLIFLFIHCFLPLINKFVFFILLVPNNDLFSETLTSGNSLWNLVYCDGRGQFCQHSPNPDGKIKGKSQSQEK